MSFKIGDFVVRTGPKINTLATTLYPGDICVVVGMYMIDIDYIDVETTDGSRLYFCKADNFIPGFNIEYEDCNNHANF